MNKLKNYLLAILLSTTIGGAVMATIPSGTASAANCSGQNQILTFPSWYRDLATTDGDTCRIKSPDEVGGLATFIWRIVLNILDMLLQLVGYIAVGFILYGGFMYLTSGGSADNATKARKTILNAVIGLLLAITSVAIINLISSGLNI